MKKNQGISLVEIVVMVAIIGILLAIVIPSFNSLYGNEAQKGTENLTASLDFTRNQAMDKLVGQMRLYQDEKNNTYVEISYYDGKTMFTEDPQIICDRKAKVTYKTEDSSGWQELDNTGIIITFDRVSGAFRPIQEQSATVSSELNVSFADSADYCEELRVVGGTRIRIISLQKLTGTYVVTKGDS